VSRLCHQVGAACAQRPGLQAERARSVPRIRTTRRKPTLDARLLIYTGTDRPGTFPCLRHKQDRSSGPLLTSWAACMPLQQRPSRQELMPPAKRGRWNAAGSSLPYNYNPFARSSRRYSRMPLRQQNGCSFSPQRRGNFEPNFTPRSGMSTTLMRTAAGCKVLYASGSRASTRIDKHLPRPRPAYRTIRHTSEARCKVCMIHVP
jgi:hypothetical protein